jgi:hypothetical protein
LQNTPLQPNLRNPRQRTQRFSAKQSQFGKAEIALSPFVIGPYTKPTILPKPKNKANQSQFKPNFYLLKAGKPNQTQFPDALFPARSNDYGDVAGCL